LRIFSAVCAFFAWFSSAEHTEQVPRPSASVPATRRKHTHQEVEEAETILVAFQLDVRLHGIVFFYNAAVANLN
jgi:hypothetical protein